MQYLEEDVRIEGLIMKSLVKIGSEQIFSVHHDKMMLLQKFQNLHTKKIEERVIFRGGKISSIVFPLTYDGFVVAIEQFRHGSNCIITELPGGNIEHNESPEEAGARELGEETGYGLETIILLAKKIFYEPCCFENFFYPILALNCKKISSLRLDLGENLITKLIPLEEWVRKTQNGEIVDGKSIITTHLALSHLKKL